MLKFIPIQIHCKKSFRGANWNGTDKLENKLKLNLFSLYSPTAEHVLSSPAFVFEPAHPTWVWVQDVIINCLFNIMFDELLWLIGLDYRLSKQEVSGLIPVTV